MLLIANYKSLNFRQGLIGGLIVDLAKLKVGVFADDWYATIVHLFCLQWNPRVWSLACSCNELPTLILKSVLLRWKVKMSENSKWSSRLVSVQYPGWFLRSVPKLLNGCFFVVKEPKMRPEGGDCRCRSVREPSVSDQFLCITFHPPALRKS